MKNSQRLCRIYELVKEWNKLIDEFCKLEFCKLKEEIAEEECEKEGYPSNGTNYELRVESHFDGYYFKRIDEICEELYSLGYDLGKLS